MKRASASVRAMAFLIDLAILVAVGLLLHSFSLLGYAIGSGWSAQTSSTFPFRLLALLVGLFCFASLTMDGAQTIGKQSMGIRVVRSNGEDVGIVRSLWRSCCYLLSASPFFLGFFLAFLMKGRSLHDLLAGTMVVKEES